MTTYINRFREKEVEINIKSKVIKKPVFYEPFRVYAPYISLMVTPPILEDNSIPVIEPPLASEIHKFALSQEDPFVINGRRILIINEGGQDGSTKNK